MGEKITVAVGKSRVAQTRRRQVSSDVMNVHSHANYLRLLFAQTMRHADAWGNAVGVAAVALVVLGVSGVANAYLNLVPGGGVYASAGVVGIYLASKAVWDTDQRKIAELDPGVRRPDELVELLRATHVSLNGHATNHAAVLRACWQKLAQGASESTIEHELHHDAYPPPANQPQNYLVAIPDLDFFFGQLLLSELIEIVVVRVPADLFSRVTVSSVFPQPGHPQEIVGPTDERRYVLTVSGRRVVEELLRSNADR